MNSLAWPGSYKSTDKIFMLPKLNIIRKDLYYYENVKKTVKQSHLRNHLFGITFLYYISEHASSQSANNIDQR